jgi:hypothetical protein
VYVGGNCGVNIQAAVQNLIIIFVFNRYVCRSKFDTDKNVMWKPTKPILSGNLY